MRLICAPDGIALPPVVGNSLRVILYGQAARTTDGCAGSAIRQHLVREMLVGESKAWDFLSLALSVVSADLAGHRERSPDGWTRELEVVVAVSDPDFWNSQTGQIEAALAFLTTDRWSVAFIAGGVGPPKTKKVVRPDNDCIALMSGGLDSLVGAIDLAARGRRPLAVSQVSRGDAEKQVDFAKSIGGGLRHLQLNHNATVPDQEEPPTQRARSLVFIAYGVLAASTLMQYDGVSPVKLFLCENGFIAINPPLTPARLGSLSTRTAHPVFVKLLRGILDAARLRVDIENPYRFMTKGEMLAACLDQALLSEKAFRSTSCGRFMRFGYRHCGRCVPCQIRRAAFLAWGKHDGTSYVYEHLGKKDADHARFDDVRSAAMAIAESSSAGLENWIGASLSRSSLGDVSGLVEVVGRGLAELAALHQEYGVK